MKKILVLFLSLVMCASFACCGLFEAPNQDTPPSNPPQQSGENTGENSGENAGNNEEENAGENSGNGNQSSGGTPIQPIKPGGDYEVGGGYGG